MSENNNTDLNEVFEEEMDDSTVITVPIDETLSNSGEAADAAAVGAALALKADKDELPATIKVNGQQADNQGLILINGTHIPVSGTNQKALAEAITEIEQETSGKTAANIPMSSEQGAETISEAISGIQEDVNELQNAIDGMEEKTAANIPMETGSTATVKSAMETLDRKAVKSVNRKLPDAAGDVDLSVVPLAENLQSDKLQSIEGEFIIRTTGGNGSVSDGKAYPQHIYGNSRHDGYVAEELNMTVIPITRTEPDEPITATIDRDVFVAYVDESGTINLYYTTEWSADPELYGITVTGTPVAGDQITVVYVKEVRGTITVANPARMVGTGWNLFDYNNGYARVVKYSDVYGYKIGGTYTSLAFSATLTGDRTSLLPNANGLFNVPGDGYVFVTGGNGTDTYILATWSDWTEGPSTGYWEAYRESGIDLSAVVETYFPYGMLKIGTVRDEIDLVAKRSISRIERMVYSEENRAAAAATGRSYDFDENNIYIVREESVQNAITIGADYSVSEHGLEWFTETELPLDTEILYGKNLRDKLERDVLTISPQNLVAEEQAQVRRNIGVMDPPLNGNGTAAQLLKTNGDGTTEWTTQGTPTDAQVGTAVSAWLTAHPEATTTVEDGAISRAKLDADLKEKTDAVPDLKSALSNSDNYGLVETDLNKNLQNGYWKPDGTSKSSQYWCRTSKLSEENTNTAIVLNSDTYIFRLTFWKNNAVIGGTPEGYTKVQRIPNDADAYGVTISRADGALLTDNDKTTIRAALKKAILTDKTLTMENYPADAKAAGDRIGTLETAYANQPVIDDAAGIGSVNKLWSASKAATEISGVATNVAAIQSAMPVIDDTAGSGATGKTWSANKLTTEIGGIESDVSDIEDDVSALQSDVSGKVNKPTDSPNGTSGQLLRTNGDGSTEWVNQGLPTDAQTAAAVDDWLDNHPEATTTVQDNSLGIAKLTSQARFALENNYATPYQFGAVGDGETDDTEALTDCAEYCAENNMLLYIPKQCIIYLPLKTTIAGVKTIKTEGTIIAPNGIVFQANSNNTGYSWNFGLIEGEIDIAGLKSSLVSVLRATTLKIIADSTGNNIGSVAYNRFVLGYVQNVILQGIGAGWINENIFTGGRIKSLLFADGGTRGRSHNKFYDCDFESNSVIELYKGAYNYIYGARFEGSNSVIFHEGAQFNFVQKSYGEYHAPYDGNPDSDVTWTDANGTNYFVNGMVPALKVYEKLMDIHSFNYNTKKMYPLNGKLHNESNNNKLLYSNLIPISHCIGVKIESDQQFFRAFFELYDNNGDRITSEPSYSPFSTSLTWDDTLKVYKVGSVNQRLVHVTASRKNIGSGNDSGVSFIIIQITGTGASDIDFFKCSITAPYYVNMTPFKPDQMESDNYPSSGNWSNGALVHNTDSSNSCFGWYYLNGEWKELS